jgi:hypothetical protein
MEDKNLQNFKMKRLKICCACLYFWVKSPSPGDIYIYIVSGKESLKH